MIVFAAFVSVIAPVYIAPLFNQYKKLEDPRVKDPILSMARANGIPATDVYEFDASRQVESRQRQCQRLRQHAADFAERQSAEALRAG